MELTIEPRGWIYTFTANHAQDPRKNCGLAPAMTTGEEPRCTLEPIPLDQSEAYRRVALGAGSGDAKKTPGKTIEISGEVLLPKE
jgi:hypothetical protein